MTVPTESEIASQSRGRAGSRAGQRVGLAMQPLLASPVVQGLVALAAYLAVWTLWRAYPLVGHPWQAQLDRSSMDPSFYTWSLRWWPYALTHGLDPLRTAQLGAPAGYNLAWDTTVPSLALLAWPLTASIGPVAAFNLLVAFSIPVSGWAAFVLCRRLTSRFWPALAAGFVYGFSAYEMNHVVAGQVNMAFSLLLPLIAYLVLAWRDGAIKTVPFVAALTLMLAAQFYLFLETFAFLTGLGVVALLAGWALAGPSARPQVTRLARLAGLSWLGSLVLAAPFLVVALASTPTSFHRIPGTTSIDLAGLVVPRTGQSLGLSWLAATAAHLHVASFDGYVGIPLLVLAVACAVLCWSRRTTRFLVVMLIVVIVGAIGPVLYVGGRRVASLPWAALFNLPVVRGAFPSRLMVFAFLILAVMIALWLAGPARRWQAQLARWSLVVLAVAAVAADVPALSINGSGTPAFIATGQYRSYLTPGATVVVASASGNVGMRWQAQSGFYFRLAGGFVNAAFNGHTDLMPALADLVDHPVTPASISSFRQYVTTSKIEAILVDADSMPTWSGKLRRFGMRPLASGHPIGGVIVYLSRSLSPPRS